MKEECLLMFPVRRKGTEKISSDTESKIKKEPERKQTVKEERRKK